MTITSEHSIRVDDDRETHILEVYDEHRNLLASVEVHENPGTNEVIVKVEGVEERISMEFTPMERPK